MRGIGLNSDTVHLEKASLSCLGNQMSYSYGWAQFYE